MSPEGIFTFMDFLTKESEKSMTNAMFIAAKKRLTKVTRPTVNLNHLPFQVNQRGPFKQCSFHAMPCVDVKTN